MKKIVIVPLLFACLKLSAQDSLYNTERIKQRWNALASQFQKRSDLISVFCEVINGAGYGKKVKTEKLVKSSGQFFILCRSIEMPDPAGINLIKRKNDTAKMLLARILVECEQFPKLKKQEAFYQLQGQLEGCENKIALSKKEYNDICRAAGRADLVFDEPVSEKAPQIKF